MSLAALFNVPEDAQGVLVFSFHNADQHLQIVRQARAQKNVILREYVLDPISSDDPATWLRVHQQAHAEFTEALGIAGVDLTDVDFNDKEQLNSWMRLHGDEHRLAADMLGFA